MFDRLIEALGTISTKDDAVQVNRAETQLAVAILLYAVIPADRVVLQEEVQAFRSGLLHIFDISDDNCRKLMSQASKQYHQEPTLLAPATLLKHRLSPSFRNLVFTAARSIAMSDGNMHENEADVLRRIEMLLAISIAPNAQIKISA